MPTFAYRAISKTGETVSGEASAPSRQALDKELAAGGYFVQEVRRKHVLSWNSASRRVSRQSRLEIAGKLVVLFRSGLRLQEILAILRETVESEPLRRGLARVEAGVNSGRTLSAACSELPDVFDGMFIVSLRMGEKTGNMAGCIEEYAAGLRKEIEVRKKVDQALYYPMFIIVVAILAIVVLSTTVLPRITQLYTALGSELPLHTRLVVDLAGFVGANWYFIPLLLLPAVMVARRGRTGEAWLRNPLLFFYATPDMRRLMNGLQYARSMSMLLKSGMTVSEALESLSVVEKDAGRMQRLQGALRILASGGRMSDACRELGLFSRATLGLIEVGERTACLPRMLDSVAALYEDQLETKLKRYVALVEPSLMLIMGGIVGGIIILLYLPILTMADLIR